MDLSKVKYNNDGWPYVEYVRKSGKHRGQTIRNLGEIGTCKTCGKEIFLSRSSLLYSKHRFCSHKCQAELRYPPVYTKCSWCGKEFRIAPIELKEYSKHFCSRECFRKDCKENPPNGYKKVKRICRTCGKEFEILRCLTEKTLSLYCSKSCAQIKHPMKPVRDYTALPYEWGYLFGVLCSDGCISTGKKNKYAPPNKSIKLLVKDMEFMDTFLEVIEKITGVKYERKLRKVRQSLLWDTQITNPFLTSRVLEFGDFRTKTWRIPGIVVNGNVNIKRGFLNGFFAGDGSVIQKRTSIGMPMVPQLYFCSSNKAGLLQIGNLLSSFGIHFWFQYSLKHRTFTYYKKTTNFFKTINWTGIMYRIIVGRKNDALNYWEQIGMANTEKRDKFLSFLNQYSEKRRVKDVNEEEPAKQATGFS